MVGRTVDDAWSRSTWEEMLMDCAMLAPSWAKAIRAFCHNSYANLKSLNNPLSIGISFLSYLPTHHSPIMCVSHA